MSVYNVDKLYHETLNQKTSYINYTLEHIDENLSKRNIKFPNKELKQIMDEAARLCSKHGLTFESKLLKESDSDEKLSFIKQNNEYRPYFELKLNEYLLKASKGLIYDDLNENETSNLIGKKRINDDKIHDNNFENVSIKHIFKNPKHNVENRTIVTDNLDKIRKIFDDKLDSEIDNNQDENDNNFLVENSLFEPFNIEPINKDNLEFNFNSTNFKTQLTEKISEKQDEIIKLTAQFASKNEIKFIDVIRKNEEKNSLFNFLNPSNNLYSYFMDILKGYKNLSNLNTLWGNKLEIYSKIADLNFHTEKLTELSLKERYEFLKIGKWKGFSDNNFILQKAKDTFVIEKKRLDKEKEENIIKNTENKLLSSVCWNTFSIVEIIDYEVEERKIKALKTEKNSREISKNQLEYNIHKIDNKDQVLDKNQFIQSNDTNENLIDKIKNNKSHNILVVSADQHMEKLKQMNKKINVSIVTCVFCNRKIPENEYQEHLKIELLDPKWKDIKNEINKRKEEKTFNDNDVMVKYLREFKNGRPDLFENSTNDEVVWDGVAQHLTRMTASVAMNNTQNKKLLEEQRKNELLKEQKLREMMMLNKNLENCDNLEDKYDEENKNIYLSNLGKN